jgi:hypothetical protein
MLETKFKINEVGTLLQKKWYQLGFREVKDEYDKPEWYEFENPFRTYFKIIVYKSKYAVVKKKWYSKKWKFTREQTIDGLVYVYLWDTVEWALEDVSLLKSLEQVY